MSKPPSLHNQHSLEASRFFPLIVITAFVLFVIFIYNTAQSVKDNINNIYTEESTSTSTK